MSSGQWEVVGKGKKSQNGKVKNGKDEEKKPSKNGNLQDVFPQSKGFHGLATDDSKKAKKNGGKAKKSDKKSDGQKQKPPKTFEAAIEAIDATELSTIITTNKLRFTNAPLVWLKEISNYLNTKIPFEVDDVTFANQSHLYPSCLLPEDVKDLLGNVFEEVGKSNAQLFFDITLTALANDMSRNLHVNGHRLLLQLLAQDYPEFCISSIPKSVTLRSSYQNRPPIGLSLLWSFGQGGHKDINIGLQAWQDLFLPLIELKNYNKYIISYLTNMLDKQADFNETTVSQEKLLTMIDNVNSKKNSLTKEQSSELMVQLVRFKDVYFSKNNTKLQVTFNQLMKKLPNQYLYGDTLDQYNEYIVRCLVECLVKDDTCNSTWRQLLQRGSKQSATLLDYIDSHWLDISKRIKHKPLKATLIRYREISEEAINAKKKDETATKTFKICQGLLDKMTSSSRRFPWVWASVFLFFSIIGLVAYDVARVGGNFPKSATGRLLNDLGILEQSQRVWQKSLSTSARGYLWLETNAPIYYTQTVEYTKPYAELTRDATIVGLNKLGVFYSNIREYVVVKTPVVLATIDEYAPGLVENVQSYASAGWLAVRKHTLSFYEVSADYLKTKVFVGDWAPEVLQNKTEIALNATKEHVTTYYHWLRQQVHLYSEIP